MDRLVSAEMRYRHRQALAKELDPFLQYYSCYRIESHEPIPNESVLRYMKLVNETRKEVEI